jgi:hypothetical protein
VGAYNRRCLRTLGLAALFLICISAMHAQTCTRVNMPAVIVQGQTFQPAIVNGVDNVSYSTVRFQWMSDATAHPINLNRLVYATAAQWAGNPGVYPYTSVQMPVSGLSNTTLQGNIVNNLAPATTYHIAGQSSTNNGSTWCAASATDTTFTTLTAPAVIPKPTPPNTFSVTEPTITGTDYTVGVSPCTTFAACIAVANPGDGIGIPPGTPVVLPSGDGGPAFSSWKIPAAATAVTPNYSTSTFSTASVAALSNGEQVHVGSYYYIPSPMNPGVTYSLINVDTAANTFQVSQDGTNPLTLNDNGIGAMYVVPWPLTQSYVVIHSAASAANLPPSGVRLDPVAYGPYLGVIEMSSPGTNIVAFSFTGYYWFRDIEFTVAPNAPATEIDPKPSGEIFQTGPLSDHIVFDQCWFHPAPAPDRIENAAIWGGTNQAIMNSYFDNVDFWRPTRIGASSTVATNSVTVQPMTYSWVGSGNTKQTCTLSSPATLTVSGSSGLTFFLYWTINPCQLTAAVQNGLTATGSAFNIVTSASPSYPVDGASNSTVLQIGAGTFYGTATGYADAGITGASRWITESATGLQMGDGPGPFMFLNNNFTGEGIIGVFKDEYVGNACNGAPTPCQYIYNTIDLTVQRNTIQWDPKYFNSGYVSSPLWNGSWWFGRNAFELKQGDRALYDGNIVGPVYGGLANGECWDLLTYYGSDNTSLPNVQTTSDIQISNNTCANSGSTVTMEGWSLYQYGPGNPQQRIWIYNNLFLNNNGWLSSGSPYENIAQGRGIRIGGDESVTVNHNTFYGQAGTGSSSIEIALILSGGLDIENNIFSYSAASAVNGFGYDTQGGATSSPVPADNTQGSALLSYLNATTFANNVFLGTWSNDNPSSLVEMTSAQVSTAAALYPPNTWFPSGSSLANRTANVFWFTPGGYGTGTGDYRLNHQSPYTSGGLNHASDGYDVGADLDKLDAAQGKVSNVHVFGLSSSGATVGFLAPDGFGCSVDYGTANFPGGSGTWTRVLNPGGQRVQNATLTGLNATTTYHYRVNCGVVQPTGSFTTTAPAIPAVLRASWTAAPGKALQIFGGGFGTNPTQLTVAIQALSTGSLTPVGAPYSLTLVDVQNNMIQGTLPAAIPADVYVVWVGTAAGWSQPLYINRAEVFWSNAPGMEIYPGQTVGIVGRNFLNPTTGSVSGLVVKLLPTGGGTPLTAAVTNSNGYAVTFTVPAVTANTTYTVQMTNGAGGIYGVVTGMDDEAFLTAVAGNSNVAYFDTNFSLNAAWVSTIPTGSTFAVAACGGSNDTAAIQTQLTAAGNAGGGIVTLPAGTCASSDLTVPGNVFINGAGLSSTTVNYISPNSILFNFASVTEPNGIANLSVVSTTVTVGPPVVAYTLLNKSGGGFFAESVALSNADGNDVGASGDLIIENSTLTASGQALQDGGNPGAVMRIKGNTMTNTVRPLMNVGSQLVYGWLEGNTWIGSGCWSNQSQVGCAGGPFGVNSGEHRILDVTYCCEFIYHNTSSGVFGTPAVNDGEGLLWQQQNRQAYSVSSGSNTSTTLNDLASPAFTTNAVVGYQLAIIGGTGIGQLATISANTAHQFAISSPWVVIPDYTSIYVIDQGVNHHNIVYDNALAALHNNCQVEMFTKNWDNVVAGNTISNGCGIFVTALEIGAGYQQAFTLLYPHCGQSYCPVTYADMSYFTYVAGNTLNPRGDTENDRQNVGTYSGYQGDVVHGTVRYGDEYVDNNITGPGSMTSSLTCYFPPVFSPVACGGAAFALGGIQIGEAASTSSYPFAQAVLIQDNAVTSSVAGVWLYNTNYDTFLNGNTLTGNGAPTSDSGSVRTTIH